jgi:hypothetical protein
MSRFCARRHEAYRVDLHVRREGVSHLAAARQRDQRRGLLGGRPGQVCQLKKFTAEKKIKYFFDQNLQFSYL